MPQFHRSQSHGDSSRPGKGALPYLKLGPAAAFLSLFILTATTAAQDRPVIYEVNVQSFSSNGLPGVTARLSHLKELGVEVVWLMPIYPIGKLKAIGSPYAVADYEKVNPAFGTLGDLQRLVSAAHGLGIEVILDWVANHTSWDNPWLAHKDWYLQDSTGNVIPPPGTNWNDVAKLNYSNASMRRAMIESMEYWIDKAGIDGFRCDAADFVPSDFWKEDIAALRAHTPKPLLMLAEGSKKEERDAGFDLLYGWDFYGALKGIFHEGTDARNLRVAQTKEAFSPRMRYVTNHDVWAWESRPDQVFSNQDGVFAAFAIAALYGGAPMIYDGQEVGWQGPLPLFSAAPIKWPQHSDLEDRYRALLVLRKSSQDLVSGELRDYSFENVVAFSRGSCAVIVNTRPSSVDFTVPLPWVSRTWKDGLSGQARSLGEKLRLSAYEVLVLSPR